MTELQAGFCVTEKVELVRPLGRGGMGDVWLAHHRGLETEVAVKFMASDHASDPDATQRFKREAAAAAKIKSAHVVQIFDHGATRDGRHYIVMERLEGEDLARRMQRAGPLPVAFVCDVVTQVLKALSRAHALAIVHRDIKPENVFVSEHDGERLIKLLDFGVAKNAKEQSLCMTSTGVALGSPYYMSPEQVISAKSVDARSDLWSVGVLAYHAMTGRLPFLGDTVGALAIAINDGHYPKASEVRPGIPAVIDEWLARALVKDPDERFQSAREMSQALSRALSLVKGTDFGDAETDVSDSTEPETTVRPLVSDIRASAASLPELAPLDVPDTMPLTDPVPSPAMTNTHLTATVSVASKPRHALALGVAAGALGFVAIVGLVAIVSRARHSDDAQAIPAAPVEVATAPTAAAAPTEQQASVVPTVAEPARADPEPGASASAARAPSTDKKAAAPRPHAKAAGTSTPLPHKYRGF